MFVCVIMYIQNNDSRVCLIYFTRSVFILTSLSVLRLRAYSGHEKVKLSNEVLNLFYVGKMGCFDRDLVCLPVKQ